MTNRRIVLIGFMGSGKTSVGKELARCLKCDFVDLDSFIDKTQGRSPAEIIEQDGEPAFRLIETAALEVVLKTEAAAIALGGGAWTIPANRRLIENQNCLIVWLDAPFELCWKRITSGDRDRPLAPDPKSAAELYQSRGDSYALAPIRIEVCEGENLEVVVGKILSRI
jgi:shikimate kinase